MIAVDTSVLVRFVVRDDKEQFGRAAAAAKQCCATEAQSMRATIETWNRFAERHGSFADEHPTL